MKTVRIVERTGKDGVLHVSVPLGTPDAEYEVVLVVQPQQKKTLSSTPEELGWPTGFFEKTFGSINDDSFVRQPQGDLPKSVDFE